MMKNTFASIKFLLVSTVLFGGLYIVGHWCWTSLFAHQANGSQIVEDGAVKGSELLAQPYDQAVTSKGDQTVSQLSPYDTTQKTVAERTATLLAETPPKPVCRSIVTASGSGVDPDISVEAALFNCHESLTQEASMNKQFMI